MSVLPLISVLLPVRNGEKYLPEAIASIEAQTYRKYEVVAVDDGSTDDSRILLERWAERDDRVRVFQQEPEGIVSALELARSKAAGFHLARMDADDIASPYRFELQIQLMESDSTLALCGCEVEYFPIDRKSVV